MDVILKTVSIINTYLSNYILLFLLAAIGVFYSIKTHFVQIRCFKEGWKKMFGSFSIKGEKHKSGLSSFQSLTTAIAAQVGTGNIVGACGAILIGGPGSIFWMWIIAFFGMATIYAEAIAAQKTRIVEDKGIVKGGPVYYITSAFKGKFGKFLARFFAVAAVLALGFMGAMVQSNSIAESCSNALGIKGWTVGVIIALISSFIFIGGIQRIGSVTEKMIPIMATLYITGGMIVLIINYKYIPATFASIFKYAFYPKAILGGSFGSAIYASVTQGAKRGLFSNEAGMGSTPHAHAQANVKNPHDQGVVAMIGVFVDTFIVLTITALIVLSTFFTGDGSLNPSNFSDGVTLEQAAETAGITKTNLAQLSFGTAFGADSIGKIFVAACLLFFAFSTIISWNLFGRINAVYLFGKKFDTAYSIIAVIFIFLGSILSNDLVWELTDMFNNLMVIPNVIALFALSKTVVAISESNRKNKLLE